MSESLRPLVLLDVDGVINDLASVVGRRRPWETTVVSSHGYEVHIPDFMPELIQRIAAIADVYWLTTWRERANNEIATHLGVGPFPVIDDGTRDGFPFWKPKAAQDLARQALDQGRRVIWFEDFGGEFPVAEMPDGTEFVDTLLLDSHDAVLDPDMVAAFLPEAVDGWTDYNRWLTVPLAEQRRDLIQPPLLAPGGNGRYLAGLEDWAEMQSTRPGVAGAHRAIKGAAALLDDLVTLLRLRLEIEAASERGEGDESDLPDRNRRHRQVVDEATGELVEAIESLRQAHNLLATRWPPRHTE